MTTEDAGDSQGGQDISLAQAIEIVKAADGQNVLDDSAFAKLREKAGETATAPLRAEIERLNAEVELGSTARAALKAQEDEGKTAEQLYQEQLKEKSALAKQAQAEATQAKTETAAANAKLAVYRRDQELAKLLTNAEKPGRARREALAAMPGIGLSTEGELTLTDRHGELLVGEAATAAISGWWEGEKDLHASAPPGPSTGGGPTPPAPAPPTNAPIYPPGSTFRQRQVIAQQFMDKEAAARRGSGGG